MFFNIFKKKDEKEIIKEESKNSKDIIAEKKTKEYVAARKGEIGEYKIDIQLGNYLKSISTFQISWLRTQSQFQDFLKLIML
ncbi:hypothetical protein [Metabacillus endolithicus]|uniref:hypothetical protein n=1 Tax=Metabacillus endolithicus TaxID=1535204 RepID=UPI001FFB873F|nr:hypothetical protein [Metabacillus endolithicus]UPG65540.1 hypothetical protein MVE64_11525 [Metabacillus endolithicus]